MKTSSEEKVLIAGCLKRDRKSVEIFSLVYGEPLHGFLQSLLGEKAEQARDFLIESMAELLLSSSSAPLTEPIRIRLMKSVLQKLRRGLKQKEAGPPAEGLDRRLSLLFECLSRLAWEERVLILLRDQMDFSLEEIKAVLSGSQMKIRANLSAARLKLRGHLHQALNNNPARPS